MKRSLQSGKRLIELPDIGERPVKDAADFFAANGTAEGIREMAAKASEYLSNAELTANAWFKHKFPSLDENHGEPVLEQVTSNRSSVLDVSEDFMAATLGVDGNPEAPTVYVPLEDRFYSYVPSSGISSRKNVENRGSPWRVRIVTKFRGNPWSHAPVAE